MAILLSEIWALLVGLVFPGLPVLVHTRGMSLLSPFLNAFRALHLRHILLLFLLLSFLLPLLLFFLCFFFFLRHCTQESDLRVEALFVIVHAVDYGGGGGLGLGLRPFRDELTMVPIC